MINYGLIGKKLGHSFSKDIHGMISDYDYRLYEMEEQELIYHLEKKDFKAVNITIPYKKTVIPYLDEISEQAKSIGAVNCIRNVGGKLYGHNTDFDGLTALLLRVSENPAGKKVMILGTGGTSCTAYAVSKALGAKDIKKVSRSGKDSALSYEQSKKYGADIIINTTPVGMFPNNGVSPLNLDDFPNVSAVCDAVFNPLRTRLVLDAKQRGIPAEGGLYMLVSQAVKAYEFFTGEKCRNDLTENIFKKLSEQKTNIVLTGLPASGKTTVGKILAQRLGRDFFDTDEEIVKAEKREITDIFASDGEEYFRDAESEIIAEISKKTGVVIATGGGAVLRSENIYALKANGKIYFRDRELTRLIPTADRPTANTEKELKKRFEERYPIYLSTADFVVKAQETALDAADEITEDFTK